MASQHRYTIPAAYATYSSARLALASQKVFSIWREAPRRREEYTAALCSFRLGDEEHTQQVFRAIAREVGWGIGAMCMAYAGDVNTIDVG